MEGSAPHRAKYVSQATRLEEALVNLNTPFDGDDVEDLNAPSSSAQRHQIIDPRYKQILEAHHYIRENKLNKPIQPQNAAITKGYNLRARINNKVYRQTPEVAAYLATLTNEIKSLLPDEINPSPPIFIHVSKAPVGDTDPK